MSNELDGEQMQRLRRFGLEEVARSEKGRIWIERMQTHGPELTRLYSGRSVVQQRSERALAHAAALVGSHKAVVGDEIVNAFDEMLDAVDAGASLELRRLTKTARRELRQARGKTIRDALGIASS